MPISKKRVIFYSFFVLILFIISIFSLAFYQLQNLGEIKKIAVEKIKELTGREVSIGDAEIDFVRGLNILLKDVSVKSRWDSEPELEAREVKVTVKLLPLLDKKLEVKQIVILGSSLRIVRNASGEFSVGEVHKWISKPTDSKLFKLLKVSLTNQIRVEGSSFYFLDFLNQPSDKPLSFEFDHIHFSLKKSLLKFPFQFTLKGEIPNSGPSTVFQINGAFDNFFQTSRFKSPSIDGNIRLKELNISKFQPYLKKVIGNTPVNSQLSIDSSFSGNLGGTLKAEGILKYSSYTRKMRAVIRDSEVPARGGIKYKLSVSKDSISFEELKAETGPFQFRASGSLKNIFSKDPAIFIQLQTDFFRVNRVGDYLPIKIFSKTYVSEVQKVFKNGWLKFNSFKFDGTLNQLKEISKPVNGKKIAGEIEMKKVDWQNPLPPIEKVTGVFKVRNGNSSFNIQKSHYNNQSLNNLNGTIDNFLTNPVVNMSFENKVKMEQLHFTLKKAFKGDPVYDELSMYSDLKGWANIRLDAKGPLKDFDNLSVKGEIIFQDVSLKGKKFKSKIENLNGKIFYTHTPKLEQRKNEPWRGILKYKNLSGKFSHSKFTNLNGDLGYKNEELLEKATVLYHLDARDLNWIMKEESDGRLLELQQGLIYNSGNVLIKYRFEENPEKPETKKEWSEVELKNLSIKYQDRLRILKSLRGKLYYDKKKIRLENITGFYGGSPLFLEGEIDRSSRSNPQFSIQLKLPELLKTDLKSIPIFNNFNYSGLANISINMNGTPKNIKFEQKADLTTTKYKIAGLIQKKENTLNQFNAKGIFSGKDGLDIENWIYQLGGNKISGSIKIPNLDNPNFVVKLESQEFKADASHQLSKSWTTGGHIDFVIYGEGNLDNLQDSDLEGKINLVNLKVKPEKISSDLTLNADLRFKENRFDIRSANVALADSEFNFSGIYERSDVPNLEIKLTGKKLDINELMNESHQKDAKVLDLFTKTDFFKKAKGQILFDVGQFNFRMLRLNNVKGKISLKDKNLQLSDWNIGTNPLVKSSGNFRVDEMGVNTFGVKIAAKNVKTENVFSLFGDTFKEGLSGDVKKFYAIIKGKGKNWAEICDSLRGKISLNIQSGRMDKTKLKHGVDKLFAPDTSSFFIKEDKSEPFPFKQLSGDFVPKNGIFQTQNLILETIDRRTTIVGTFDLGKKQMDTVVGVAPMAGLDRLLTKIPVVGKIITGGDEKSFLKTYYKVKGDFYNPDISAIPFTSLSKKLMGVFQGIVQAPIEIIGSLPKTKNPKGISSDTEDILKEDNAYQGR